MTLAINGDERAYANDKAGKRQAILDGLSAIETVQVEEDEYLSNNAALQVVAAVLYPAGIQTREAYDLVCRVTEKACAHLGYGEEVVLGPPQVSLDARGSYRKRYQSLDPKLVLAELALALSSRYFPRRESNRRSIWNKTAWEIYDRPFNDLTAAQQMQLQAQIDAAAADAGWEQSEDNPEVYIQPLPANKAGARQRLERYLRDVGGRPVAVRTVLARVQSGAYGRTFYDDELTSDLAVLVADVLRACGYQVEPEAGEYLPVMVAMPEDSVTSILDALAAVQPVTTNLGQSLLLSDVLSAVKPLLDVGELSEWQAERLLRKDVITQALRQLGYQTEFTWCQPYQFQPKLATDRAQQIFLKEVRVQSDPNMKLSLADGLSVYTPAIAIDDEDDTLVYLEMIGAKQSVKANWAALASGGGRVHWIGRKRVQLNGMKEHVRIQSTLPCRWTDYILIHKQASLKEMNPECPFYLLDDGALPIPPLFYAMLNKALALPLLPAWTEYLWRIGRNRDLISLLDGGEGQGYAAWRVLPAVDEWQQVIQAGLETAQLILSSH